MMQTKYIILIWIIILILLTLYCIVRLGYLHEKYGNITTLNSSNVPIIAYINNIQKQNNITDMPGCADVFDDNILVQSLGYNSCQNAYSDYLAKNLDVNSKYGQTKSLADMCPVSSKTEKYSKCLKDLMATFSDNANILDSITSDMNNSITKRIDDRNTAISGIATALDPLINSKSQVEFNNNMKMNGQMATYNEDVLGLVNQYYKNKYNDGLEPFTNISSSSISLPMSTKAALSNLSTLILDPNLVDNFFGLYQVVNGQFKALDNLTIRLGYDTSSQSSNTVVPTIMVNNIVETIPPTILLSINNGSLIINYTVSNLENYNALPNAIKINLIHKEIINDTNQYQSKQDQTIIIQQLITLLGINAPSRIIMTYDDFTSSQKIKHRSYKLVNDNLDTILVLNKI